MSNPFKLQQNRISRRVVGNNGLGGGVPIWAQSTQKMLTPPPHILGGEVATGLRSGGTVLRGDRVQLPGRG